MDNSLKAYDLGNSFNLVENCQKISIDELVRKAMTDLKKRIVEAQIEALGMSITMTTSFTRFNGKRLWFVCPGCDRRVGTIYNSYGIIGCRKCLSLVYLKQRYKGMIETNPNYKISQSV